MAAMAAATPSDPNRISSGIIEVYCDENVANTIRFPGGRRGRMMFNMGNDIINDIIYNGDLNMGKNALRMPGGSLTALCKWGLSEEYIADELFGTIFKEETDNWGRPSMHDEVDSNTNLILILYDRDWYFKGWKVPRGIALCKVDVPMKQ